MENTERIQELREGGVFDFMEADIDKSLLDWSDELPNEKKDVYFDREEIREQETYDPTSALPQNLRDRSYSIVGEEESGMQ